MILGTKDRARVDRMEKDLEDYESLKERYKDKVKENDSLQSQLDTAKQEVISLKLTIEKYESEDKEQVDELNYVKTKLSKTTDKLRDTQEIDFGRVVKDLNLTYKQLSDRLGISVSTLNTYRKDPSSMPPDRYKDIKKRISALYHRGKH